MKDSSPTARISTPSTSCATSSPKERTGITPTSTARRRCRSRTAGQARPRPGRYAITYDAFGRLDRQLPNVRSQHEHHAIRQRTEREQVREMLKAVGGASGQPGLLLLEVDPCTGTCPAMGFPAQSD